MKKTRKEELLRQFPVLPDRLSETMKGRKVENFAVMLTYGHELFIRCYHRYSNGKIEERQRYVFADDGFVRYGSDDGESWSIRTDFREPVFCKSGYGYRFDNRYRIINKEAVLKSCMKYSGLEYYHGSLIMEYLHLYCKHRNVEYLVKSGYECVLEEYEPGYFMQGNAPYISAMSIINWKSNNLLKMLGLTRTEFKALQGKENLYPVYLAWKEAFPKCKPEELVMMASAFSYKINDMHRFCEITGLNAPRLALYLSSQNVRLRDYYDYLEQCRKLHYNPQDTAVSMPHDFRKLHDRLTEIIRYQTDKVHEQHLKEHISQRRNLEFQSGNLLIRQPESMSEIIAEGANLHHCVGGYAERHAEGKLHILFIRKKSAPDKSFYTMEVSTDGKIMQVRGLRNCDPVPEVCAFVKEYQCYLQSIFSKKTSAHNAA